MGVWIPNAPPGKCNVHVPMRTQFFTEYLPCRKTSYDYCKQDYCQKHCESSCGDNCKEFRLQKEKRELEEHEAEMKKWEEEREAQRLQEEEERKSNQEETGFRETNSERKDRESNAEKWQKDLEKKEQQLQHLDAEMKKHPRKNDDY
ncbi:MAG: hypothetical protein ACPHUK_08035 [Candidatus Poseidoniaceae archaeon]